jgi:hypothetical protein
MQDAAKAPLLRLCQDAAKKPVMLGQWQSGSLGGEGRQTAVDCVPVPEHL